MDIRKLQRKTIRQQISFVLQEALLFRAPIWQNIAYGNGEASREAIVRAARLANADDFIRQMPQGYDTMVGERGVTLSAGQRQRIAIARAIIRNSPILILDEPSTGLDAIAEKLVLDALANLMKDRTTIMIAHRLSAIRNADLILVLESGEIRERGTHQQLVASGGVYARFSELQARQEQEEQEAAANPLLARASCDVA
jgi:subfamily B ATP-binding cassette protein MsbA